MWQQIERNSSLYKLWRSVTDVSVSGDELMPVNVIDVCKIMYDEWKQMEHDSNMYIALYHLSQAIMV